MGPVRRVKGPGPHPSKPPDALEADASRVYSVTKPFGDRPPKPRRLGRPPGGGKHPASARFRHDTRAEAATSSELCRCLEQLGGPA